MRKCEDHDLVLFDLIDDSKREAIQDRNAAVRPISPLRRCVRKLEDRFENRVDLFFELGSEAGAARLVIVDPRHRSRRPRVDEFEGSTIRAGGAALADVRAILVERQRIGNAAVDFGTATLDFGVPRLRGAVVRFAVETTDQLVRKARTFLRREAKNVSRAHSKYSTDFRPVFPPAQHACVLGSVGQLWRSKSSGRLGLAYLSRYERAPTIAIHVSGPI
jgi:hypothetical protein